MVLVHLADATASDGATKAGLVGHQVLLAIGLARRGHGFGGDVLGAFELHVLVVACGQGAHFVDHVHQHLGAVGGEALSGDRVVGEDLFLLGHGLHERLGVAHIAHTDRASHGNGLEVLAAHHRTHAGAASRAVHVVHHRGIQHMVFTGLANTRHTHQRVLQRFLDGLFGVPHALSPQV